MSDSTEPVAASANDFSNALGDLAKAWGDSKPVSEDVFPDGTYQFKIEEASLTTVPDKKTGGKIPAVIMKFVCLSEPYQGKPLTSWDRLNPAQPNSISFFKEKMKRLNLNHNAGLMELELELRKCLNHIVTAQVQSKKGIGQGDRLFTNIYIRSDDGIDESN